MRFAESRQRSTIGPRFGEGEVPSLDKEGRVVVKKKWLCRDMNLSLLLSLPENEHKKCFFMLIICLYLIKLVPLHRKNGTGSPWSPFFLYIK